MPDGLYDRDFLLWSEDHADLLRRLAAGERVNDAIDWPNLIEEVGDLGRSEFHACESLIAQALVHLLKLHAWPGSRAANHWKVETVTLLSSARRRFTPSMRQRLDLDQLYRDAVSALRFATDDCGTPNPRPASCPYTLDQLLADDVPVLPPGGSG